MVKLSLPLSMFLQEKYTEEYDKEKTMAHLSKKEQNKLEKLTAKEKNKIEKDTEAAYGKELILSLHNVPLEMFNSKAIKKFAKDLTKEIEMRCGPDYSWGSVGDEGDYKDDDKKDGLSHIQFLWESSILIHAIDLERKIFINIFSCKNFDEKKAEKFSLDAFGGKVASSHTITRE